MHGAREYPTTKISSRGYITQRVAASLRNSRPRAQSSSLLPVSRVPISHLAMPSTTQTVRELQPGVWAPIPTFFDADEELGKSQFNCKDRGLISLPLVRCPHVHRPCRPTRKGQCLARHLRFHGRSPSLDKRRAGDVDQSRSRGSGSGRLDGYPDHGRNVSLCAFERFNSV